MSIDLKWMSEGGLLLDGTGDISLTASNMETIVAMVRTRLKSAIDGWKLYNIGAGLDKFPGNASDAALEITIKRQVLSSISAGFLPSSVFTVSTLRLGEEIQVYVYLNKQLIATASVTINTNNVTG